MNKSETNGYLKAVEIQLRAVEAAFDEVARSGELSEEAFARFREVKIDMVNLSSAFRDIRGWNTGR